MAPKNIVILIWHPIGFYLKVLWLDGSKAGGSFQYIASDVPTYFLRSGGVE